jgi:hypothetical protein
MYSKGRARRGEEGGGWEGGVRGPAANSLPMAVSEDVARDSAEEWLLPESARPRSFAEIESQVELAVSVARGSEAAVAEVGAAAIEAAEQARQAAELAERAAFAAEAASEAAALQATSAAAPAPQPQAPEAPVAPAGSAGEEWLLSFTHRAERLSARLVRLQHC